MSARHDTTGDAGGPHLGFVLPEARPIAKRRLLTVGLVVLVVLAAAFVIGYLPRREKGRTLAAANESSQRAFPRVKVTVPKVGASDRALALPGTVEPLQATMLFARGDQ